MQLAALLRAAADRAISEDDFWQKFSNLVDPFKDPIAGIAHETATHYWGNFHAKNILFIPVKPDRHQVTQGQNELNLIAEAIEKGWSAAELERGLKNI